MFGLYGPAILACCRFRDTFQFARLCKGLLQFKLCHYFYLTLTRPIGLPLTRPSRRKLRICAYSSLIREKIGTFIKIHWKIWAVRAQICIFQKMRIKNWKGGTRLFHLGNAENPPDPQFSAQRACEGQLENQTIIHFIIHLKRKNLRSFRRNRGIYPRFDGIYSRNSFWYEN